MVFRGRVSLFTYPKPVLNTDRVDGITPTREVMALEGPLYILRTGDNSYYLNYEPDTNPDAVQFNLAVGMRGKWVRQGNEYIRATVSSILPIELDRQLEIRLYNPE